MTPTCCYAIYEASACHASMGRMLLGRNSFVAFRGKPTGSLVAMKIDFSLARSPCTWNWVSMLVCSVPEHVSRLFQIYSFLCFGLVFGVTPPKKKQQTKIKSILWLEWLATKDSDDRSSIFLFCALWQGLCVLWWHQTLHEQDAEGTRCAAPRHDIMGLSVWSTICPAKVSMVI